MPIEIGTKMTFLPAMLLLACAPPVPSTSDRTDRKSRYDFEQIAFHSRQHAFLLLLRRCYQRSPTVSVSVSLGLK